MFLCSSFLQKVSPVDWLLHTHFWVIHTLARVNCALRGQEKPLFSLSLPARPGSTAFSEFFATHGSSLHWDVTVIDGWVLHIVRSEHVLVYFSFWSNKPRNTTAQVGVANDLSCVLRGTLHSAVFLVQSLLCVGASFLTSMPCLFWYSFHCQCSRYISVHETKKKKMVSAICKFLKLPNCVCFLRLSVSFVVWSHLVS